MRAGLSGVAAGALVLGLVVPGAQAQTAPRPAAPAGTVPASGEGEDEIVVVGQRPRGEVVGDIKPERVLDAASVRALGAGSVAEVLTALAPDIRSSQGRGGERPVVLVNGRRVGSFAEVRDIPSEAIARVDILPEEVALKYGYAATAKVVNIVLRRRFRAVTTELATTVATRGDQVTPAGNVNLLQINPDGRVLIDARLERRALLTEAERAVAIDPGSLDQRFARSLLPATTTASLNGVLDRSLSESLSGTLNGRIEASHADSLIGLSVLDGSPLARDRQTLDLFASASLSRTRPEWGWSATASVDHSDQRTVSDASAALRQRSRGIETIVLGEATTQGPLAQLAAGPLALTATVRQSGLWLDSDALNLTGRSSSNLSRSISRGALALDLPVASALEGVNEALGTLSFNANAAVDAVSDAGTLITLGAGTTWTPLPPVRLVVSYSREQGAPGVQQLGAPVVVTPNVRLFDAVNGSSTTVTLTEGGNPALEADTRRVFKAALSLRPLRDTDLALNLTYTRNVIDDAIVALGVPTAAVQAAFPDRFVRDATGTLIAVDRRPVSYAQVRRSDLRWGFSYARPIAADPAYAEAMRDIFRQAVAQQPGRAPSGMVNALGNRGGGAGAIGGPGGGRGGFGGGGIGGGRFSLSLHHTVRLTDSLLLAPGQPVIDLLDGGTTGDLASGTLGGRPRHEIEATAGLSRHGLGARASATWTSPVTVDSVGRDNRTLRFDDRLLVDLRLFVNLGARPELVRRAAWLRGARMTLAVDNLFDSQPTITDAAGLTPRDLQPALLEPLGRTIRLSLRKQFF